MDAQASAAVDQSVYGAALPTRKKRCRLCLRNPVKQPEDESFYDAAQSPITSVDHSNAEEVDFLSKQASEAIKTRNANHQPYLLFGHTFKLVQPTEPPLFEQSTGDFVGRSRGPALGSDSSIQVRDSMFPTKKADYKIYGRNVKAIIDNIESGNWIMSRDDDEPRRIHNVPNESSSYRAPNWPVTFSSVPKLEGPYQSHTAMDDKKHSQLHENRSNAPHQDGILNKTNCTRTSLQHRESECTARDSYSNSTTQQTSSCDSDSEEYSWTGQTGGLQSVTSSTSTKTGASLLSDGTGSRYSSYTTNGEDELLGSSAGGEEDCDESSSKSKGYSSHDQPIRRHARTSYLPMGSTSKRSGPSRTRKANKKQTGMWTSLKDKLAIIFHHHHHHHHHHNRDDQTKMRKGEAISLKRQHEEYGEKAVEKTSKTLIREKKQQNHNFHGLMEGLLRHIRNSKQSQPGKKTVDKLTKGQRGGKKTLDKSKLWRLHREGAKSPNKTHVKLLGFDKKRARLKALPNVK